MTRVLAWEKTADMKFTLREMNAAYRAATRGRENMPELIIFPSVEAYNRTVERYFGKPKKKTREKRDAK